MDIRALGQAMVTLNSQCLPDLTWEFLCLLNMDFLTKVGALNDVYPSTNMYLRNDVMATYLHQQAAA